MSNVIAISGASGKTGYRVAEEALAAGYHPRLLLRESSELSASLISCEKRRLNFDDEASLDKALQGASALIIATGARPTVDLTAPMRVDAWGVSRQVESCRRVGVKRVILVSSLCAGRWLHPLNLFGLILIWKRVGERALESSGLDWTILRPGGLSEREEGLETEGIRWSGPDSQESDSIPRRLVARCCVACLETPASIGRIIEVTSSPELPNLPLAEALAGF